MDDADFAWNSSFAVPLNANDMDEFVTMPEPSGLTPMDDNGQADFDDHEERQEVGEEEDEEEEGEEEGEEEKGQEEENHPPEEPAEVRQSSCSFSIVRVVEPCTQIRCVRRVIFDPATHKHYTLWKIISEQYGSGYVASCLPSEIEEEFPRDRNLKTGFTPNTPVGRYVCAHQLEFIRKDGKSAKATKDSLRQLRRDSHLQEFSEEEWQERQHQMRPQQEQHRHQRSGHPVEVQLLRLFHTTRDHKSALELARQYLAQCTPSWLEQLAPLLEEEWFYGYITSTDCRKAEKRMRGDRGDPGAFFVRLSLNYPMVLTLVTRDSHICRHFNTVADLSAVIQTLNRGAAFSRLDSSIFVYDEMEVGDNIASTSSMIQTSPHAQASESAVIASPEDLFTQADHDAIFSRLGELGLTGRFRRELVPGNGNCGPQAVALYLTQGASQELLRFQVHAWAATQPRFQALLDEFPDDCTLPAAEVVERMGVDGEYVGQEFFTAVASLLHCTIVQVSPDHVQYYPHTDDWRSVLARDDTIFICYNGRNHYDALIQKPME